MTKIAAMHMLGKHSLKLSFLKTKGPMPLGFGMYYWGCVPYKPRLAFA